MKICILKMLGLYAHIELKQRLFNALSLLIVVSLDIMSVYTNLVNPTNRSVKLKVRLIPGKVQQWIWWGKLIKLSQLNSKQQEQQMLLSLFIFPCCQMEKEK
jgi:hypothetical protein